MVLAGEASMSAWGSAWGRGGMPGWDRAGYRNALYPDARGRPDEAIDMICANKFKSHIELQIQ